MNVDQAEPLNVRQEIEKLSPPDYWEREMYVAAVVRRKPLDEVAEDFFMNRAEARAALAKVEDWLMNAPDDEAGDLPPQQARRLAARVVRLRMEELLTMAMQAYENSKGQVMVHRRRDKGTEAVLETITTTSHGDFRYLNHYRQTALALARLDGVCLRPNVELPIREELEAQAAWREARQRQEQAEQRREAIFEEKRIQREAIQQEALEHERKLNALQQHLLADELRRDMLDYLRLVDEARLARPAGALSEEQLAEENHLYTRAQQGLAADRAARRALGISPDSDETCTAPAAAPPAAAAAPEVQKTTYYSAPPVPADAPVGERRKAFLSGAALVDAA